MENKTNLTLTARGGQKLCKPKDNEFSTAVESYQRH